MGGTGSGRWNTHHKRSTVEAARRLPVAAYKRHLRLIEAGILQGIETGQSWTRAGEPYGNIDIQFSGTQQTIRARLIYTVTDEFGQKTDYDEPISLVTTSTPWGALRYWWSCPTCGGRCAVLYMPSNGQRFLCRKCQNLTYVQCQDHGDGDEAFEHIALMMANKYPGLTGKEVKAWLLQKKVPDRVRKFYEAMIEQSLQQAAREEYERKQALLREAEARRQARFLSAPALCQSSGLTTDELAELMAVRLLVPGRDGRYRPKLASWAKKLAYLLHTGWDIETIRRWAKGRWSSKDPRRWPPAPEDWQG